MQELTKAIQKSANGDGLYELEAAGQAWGAYCLKEMRGKLRKRGLAISAAISEFHDELVQRKEAER